MIFPWSCSSTSSYSFAFWCLFCARPMALQTFGAHNLAAISSKSLAACLRTVPHLRCGAGSCSCWKLLALVQQIQKNPSELPALVSLNEACLSAWLGWVSAQYLAGSSHYLCCNAPVPAGSGEGGCSLARCPEHQPELPAVKEAALAGFLLSWAQLKLCLPFFFFFFLYLQLLIANVVPRAADPTDEL